MSGRTLTYKYRNYLSKFFIEDVLGERYDFWGQKTRVLKENSDRARDLILQCMELVRGEGFSDFFKRNENLFQHLWNGVCIDRKSLGISDVTLVEYVKARGRFPKQKNSDWEITVNNVDRYTFNFNLHYMGPIPNLSEFNKDYELTFPKSIWGSTPFRELQNLYLDMCVESCSMPAEIVDYFYGVSWNETQPDLRTFLVPQKIRNIDDLRREYPKYYEILLSAFRKEFVPMIDYKAYAY